MHVCSFDRYVSLKCFSSLVFLYKFAFISSESSVECGSRNSFAISVLNPFLIVGICVCVYFSYCFCFSFDRFIFYKSVFDVVFLLFLVNCTYDEPSELVDMEWRLPARQADWAVGDGATSTDL